ncbi:5-(carboxyamino)imidazole ribonucleotide synthase [Motiliproteus sp. SC1-56]|uniref:5-(carboxyamino)imidazole ribonucleotide synthase n=1 Tax=Motiliproteus sp. SC1-56 TaxID=2799565 RepID=UPI001A8C02C8|nr:5-(carboxyamino)imidazole ribonucleotide synthase [Motiliproteus sp. SC1-56]
MKRLGIIGGGQLARMMALAAPPLGLEVRFLDPSSSACAGDISTGIRAGYGDPEALDELADWAEVVTFEFENVPAASVERLAAKLPAYPPAGALGTAQDRLREKNLFRDLGIGVAPFAAVDSLEGLRLAVADVGLPAVLKTRTEGYDGKGQAVLRTAADLEPAWERLGGVPLILEGFVNYSREISIIGVRTRDGAMCFYPISENTHRDGILHLAVCRASDPMQEEAQACLRKIAEALDYVGVLTLELFEMDGQLLANEIAPRVHNSGHWTIEGAETSQFENHLRAVLDLPLGATDPVGESAMVNFIGRVPAAEAVLAIPGAHLHDYQKEARTGRKVGHVTLRAGSPEALAERIAAAEALLQDG